MVEKLLNIDRLIEQIYFLFKQKPMLASDTEKTFHMDFLPGCNLSIFYNSLAYSEQEAGKSLEKQAHDRV